MPNDNMVKPTDRIHPQQADALKRNAEIVAMAVVRSRGGHDEHEAFVRVATAPTIPLGLREPRVIYDPDK